MFRSTLFAALGSFALIATAGSASAGEFISNGRTSEVRHGDLNLSKASDQRELRQRISRAANQVCKSTDHATKQGHEGRRSVAPVGPIRLQLALEVVYEGRSRLQNGGQVRTWAMLPRSGPFGHALVRIKSGRKPGFTEFKSHQTLR